MRFFKGDKMTFIIINISPKAVRWKWLEEGVEKVGRKNIAAGILRRYYRDNYTTIALPLSGPAFYISPRVDLPTKPMLDHRLVSSFSVDDLMTARFNLSFQQSCQRRTRK